MLLLALLIAKNSYKIISTPILALLALMLFIYRGQKLKPYIDSLSQATMQLLNGGGQYTMQETHWAMNMGVPFCIAMCMGFALVFYLLLLRARKS